jgi:hypothetical protein
MLAAVLETPRPERLYAGLSVLVSTAADGRPARGLASFGALPLLLLTPDELAARSGLAAPLARSLAELRALAADLVPVHACAAAVESQGLDRSVVERRLAGVLSTPRFLHETAGWQLLFV